MRDNQDTIRRLKSIEGHEDRFSTVPTWLWPALGGAVVMLAVFWFALHYKPEVALKKDISQPPALTQIEKPAVVLTEY